MSSPSTKLCERCAGCGFVMPRSEEPATAWVARFTAKPSAPTRGVGLAIKIDIAVPVECPTCKGVGEVPTDPPSRISLIEME